MIQKLVNRFAYLDALLKKRATGTPKELAQRLGLTERAWYKLRDELINDLGVPIAYDAHARTYYYKEEGQLLFMFQRKLTHADMEKLDGGQVLNYQFSERPYVWA
jgi:hypothetical protein